jgi:hypothetical protein
MDGFRLQTKESGTLAHNAVYLGFCRHASSLQGASLILSSVCSSSENNWPLAPLGIFIHSSTPSLEPIVTPPSATTSSEQPLSDSEQGGQRTFWPRAGTTGRKTDAFALRTAN